MDPDKQKQIKDLLVTTIQNIPLTGGMPDFYPNPDILGPIVKLFNKELIDPFVITNTVEQILWRECRKSYDANTLSQYSDGITASILAKIDFAGVADESMEFLNTLPRQYEYIFPFAKSEQEISLKINDDIEIRTVNTPFEEKYSSIMSPEKKLLSMPMHRMAIASEDTLLIVKNVGYANSYGYTKKYGNDPLFLYKVVCAFFEVSYLFHRNYSLIANRYGSGFNYGIVDSENVSKGFVTTLSESSDDFEYITSCEFPNLMIESQYAEFLDRISVLQKILDDRNLSAHVQKFRTSLLNSLYWYYEIEKTKQIHLKTIFLTTAFDSFFIQSDNKESKSNNIANLLGETVDEINLINKNLVNLYTNRNKIIHGEASISSTEDNKYLDREMDKIAAPCSWYLSNYIENRIEVFIRTLDS